MRAFIFIEPALSRCRVSGLTHVFQREERFRCRAALAASPGAAAARFSWPCCLHRGTGTSILSQAQGAPQRSGCLRGRWQPCTGEIASAPGCTGSRSVCDPGWTELRSIGPLPACPSGPDTASHRATPGTPRKAVPAGSCGAKRSSSSGCTNRNTIQTGCRPYRRPQTARRVSLSSRTVD